MIIIFISNLKKEWFFNTRADILSGTVVALALIPEAIAFSIIAGVDPMVGLYASFCIAIISSIFGGRPGMISAATGAMALVIAPLVKTYGLNYLFAATILTGIIQFILGSLKVSNLLKFIPRAVMIGFVNSLAILIFMAQVPHFIGISTETYIFVAITLLIIYTAPKYIKILPAPLIAILILTGISFAFNFDLRTIGDLGEIKKTLPSFSIPKISLSIDTLKIIFPYSFALSIVGLLESLLTASIVDEMTDSNSDRIRECKSQGIANIITGFFGGMAGCAMIGQSVINVKSGGRGRLSTFWAGLFLIFLILALGDLVIKIPMPVLVGIMIMVSIGTFDWNSFSYIKNSPKSESFVMILTTFTVILTHDLSKGVIIGVLLSALFFVHKISKIEVIKVHNHKDILIEVNGPLFFASIEHFINHLDFDIKNTHITINFSNTHIWDDSAANAIQKIVDKYKENNNKIFLSGLNSHSQKLLHKQNSNLIVN